MVLFPFLAPALRNRESSWRLPAAGYRVELSLRSEADRTQEIIEIRRLIGTEIRGGGGGGGLASQPWGVPSHYDHPFEDDSIYSIHRLGLFFVLPPSPVSERKEGPNSPAALRILDSFWFR